MNPNTYKFITGAATTTFAGETGRVILAGISVNKALTGTLIIKSGATTIGTIAIATPAGQYWTTTNGVEIENLSIVNSAAEDAVVFYRNI